MCAEASPWSHKVLIHELSWSDSGRLLAASDDESRIILYTHDGDTAARRFELIGHRGPPRSMVFSSDSKRLVSCSRDSLRVWNTISGVELLALTDSTERCSAVVSIGDSDELLAASGPYLRRWIPFFGEADSLGTNPTDSFQSDRRSRLEATQTGNAFAQHEMVATVTSDNRMRQILDTLKQAIESNSDTVSISTDGVTILSLEDDLRLLLEPLDVVQSISNVRITDPPTAQQAIETALSAMEDSPASLQMRVERATAPKQLIFHVEPVESRDETISLKRPDAIAIYERLKDAIRQQLLDAPKEYAWLSGAKLPMSLTQDDRNLYLKSRLAPDDVIVRINNASVTDLHSLMPIVDGLLTELKSGQRSSIHVEVMRGAFHRARFTYEVDE